MRRAWVRADFILAMQKVAVQLECGHTVYRSRLPKFGMKVFCEACSVNQKEEGTGV